MIPGGEGVKFRSYQTIKLTWDACNVYGPSDGTAVCVGTREVSDYRCLSRLGNTAEEAMKNLRDAIAGFCRGEIERRGPAFHPRCETQGRPTTKAKLGFWEGLRVGLFKYSCPK